MRTVLVVLTAALCVVAVSANAETYMANFDNDAEGWHGDGAAWVATGGQDGGYYSGMRVKYAPYLTPPEDCVLYGDVAANFGNVPIKFSYYLKDISGNSLAGGTLYMFAANGTSDYTLWQWTPEDTTSPQEWTQYSWTIDPAADSVPDGWINNNGGPLSWAESWTRVGYWNFWTDPGTGGDNINAIDTVLVESVPEPTTIALLIGALLTALVVRRR